MFLLMQKTRAAFKLSLRYCKQHQQEIQADHLANSLLDKQFHKFWNSIRKTNNSKVSVAVNTIGGCCGDKDISEMWKRHYTDLYNSVDDRGAKNIFYNRISQLKRGIDTCVITVHDVASYCTKQKKGKATGVDGIAIEALMYGGLRLHIHLAILFNLFL